MPSLYDLDDWLSSTVPSNLRELPSQLQSSISEYTSVLYASIAQYAPPTMGSLPSLPDFVMSATSLSSTPPPPPPPPAALDRLANLWRDHQRAVVVLGLGVGLGVVGVAVGPTALIARARGDVVAPHRQPEVRSGRRAEAIIILGGDTPLGIQLTTQLGAHGFIVMPTVSSASAASSFSRHVRPSSQGYVKPLVLDTAETDSASAIASFVTSLSAATELRWPLTGAGDPYAAAGERVRIAGVINALSWDATTGSGAGVQSAGSRLEQHVTLPLGTLDALLPLLRKPIDSRAASFPVTLITLLAPTPQEPGTAAMIRAAAHEGVRALSVSSSASPRKGTRSIRCATLEVPTVDAADSPRSNTPRRTTINARGETLASSRPRAASNAADTEAARLARTCATLLLAPNTARLRQHYSLVPSRPAQLYRALALHVSRTSMDEVLRFLRTAPRFLLQQSSFLYTRAAQTSRSLGQRVGLFSAPRTAPGSGGATSPDDARAGATGARRTHQPAFGPGPGPVSNSHSRTSIAKNAAPSNTAPSAFSSATQPARSLSSSRRSATRSNTARPASAHSASSGADVESGADAGSGNGLESSGLLSSVPSSAFGDHDWTPAEAEGESVDSPSISSRGTSSPPWGAASGVSSAHAASNDAASVRREQQSNAEGMEEDSRTPGASRVVFNAHATAARAPVQGAQSVSSHAQGQEEHSGPWMGPPSRASPTLAPHMMGSMPTPSDGEVAGTASPLGQSWVALGESQQQERQD